jgi:serine/threonine protein kinase
MCGGKILADLWQENCRDTVRVLLEPRPKKRPSAAQVLEFPWMRSIEI